MRWLQQPLFWALAVTTLTTLAVLPVSHAAPRSAKTTFGKTQPVKAPSVKVQPEKTQPAKGAAAKPRPKLVFKALRHIVLDPGHGGDNLGAVGHVGTREKVLTLDIARVVAAMIRQRSDLRVSMTREDDRSVALRERPRLANELGGDVLVSVHCNSSPDPEVHGMEVWFLAADSSLAAGLEVVRREEGIESDAPEAARRVGADAVITAMRLAAAHERSELLAFAVASGLRRADTGMRLRGVRQAPFGVLKEAAMAAVVLEVGYISHPEEGQHLLLASTHEALARAVLIGLLELDKQLAQLVRPEPVDASQGSETPTTLAAAPRSPMRATTSSTRAAASRSSAASPSPPSSRVSAEPVASRTTPRRRPTP
jgi:N-acetylmuramoyl-L-alanine amidase